MICHFCNREAVGRCASCGLAICQDHGNRYCQVCSEAVFSRDARPGPKDGRAYLQCPSRPEMETIYLDDDGPPSCYRCEGLARKVCQGCHNLYCLEHAGKGECCDKCTKANRLGNWVVAVLVAVIIVVALVVFVAR